MRKPSLKRTGGGAKAPGSRVMTFRKGKPRPEKAGRRAGTPNRTTTYLKHAILGAGDRVGFPKWNKKLKQMVRGAGGLDGYLDWLALNEPKAYATLLGRVLPLQITGEGGGPVRVIDGSMTPAMAAQAYSDALKASPPPDMIDITPNPPKSASLPRVIPGRAQLSPPR